MPSLFERVGRSLTRKKPEIVISSKDSARTALEGFEQVSPNDVKGYVPTESKSPVTEKAPGVFQAFLRSKSPSRADPSRYDRAPHLSLHLPDLSEGGSSIKEKLSIVFEPAPDPTYTDEVIAAKRLTTAETLAVVQKTASVITQRGLETPGIFKSFWYAQSPQTQRKLVVLFLQTLSVNTAATPNEPKPDPVEAFDDQLKHASPHDVAELFKWAIRHFNLGAPSFGTSSDEYGWYRNFAESEQAAGYPPEAYTTILGPLLPPNHLELLNAIFNFASSVASYAEVNGVSGSRFSRAIGWWLLSERQPASNGLIGFIHDWDTAARILEHLFLAYVRDQQRLGLMPKRLTQLVKSYPYPKQAAPTDQYFLPRPKFTTQQRTALFVRAAVPSHSKDHYNGKPLQLLRDALGAPIDEAVGDAEYRSLWEEVKKHATEAVTQPNSPTSPVEGTSVAPMISISGVLTENAVRTLTNAGGESTVTSPIRPVDSLPESPLWRSLSPTRRTTDGGFSTTNSTALTSPVDWDEFTGQGFSGLSGANSLTFSEFAPTPPRQSSTVGANARSTTSKKQRTTRRRSVDFKTPATNGHAIESAFPAKAESGIVSEATEGTLELDEAFIDNWAQILLDKTVASAWPSFALYELRNPLTSPSTGTATEAEADPSPTQIQWLVIETYVNAPPTEASVPSSPTKGGKVKRSSSQRSDKRRPFGFFASSSSLAGKDVKDDKTAKRKDHVRRASEISTDSFGAKHKDPSKSQVDVSTQPAAIAEEPEPTTPIPPIAEEAAKDTTNAVPEEESAAKDATEAVSAADEEVPAPAPAVAATLTIPTTTTEGSRFVEGSSPGTIPEAVTDSGDHEHRDSKSVVTDTAAAIIGTAATAAAIKHEDADDVDVPAPVSESQQHETAVMEPTSDVPHVPDALAQRGEESVPVNETIESSVPPPVEASEQAALESQTSPDAVQSDIANEGAQLVEKGQPEEASYATVDAANHVDEEEEKEKARLAEEEIARKQEEEERIRQLELERISKEQELQRQAEAQRLQEEEAARVAELERQRLIEEQAAAAEAQRLQAEAEELQRQQEEALRKAAEEKARQEELEAELQRQREAEEAAARQKDEENRLEKLRLEEIAKEEEAQKAAEAQRLQEEEAARIAELERQRLLEEQTAAAEAQRLQAEAEELQRQQEEALRKAAEEKARQEELEAELQRQKEAEEAARKEEEERLEKLRLEEIAKREEEERLEKERLEEIARREEEERLEKLRLEEIAKREEEERLEKERLEEVARREEEERLEKQRLEEIAKREEEERLEKERLEEIARREEEERLEKLRLEEIAKQEEEERKAAEAQRLQEEEAARIAELERQRLIEEQAAAAEAQRLQAEAEELQRQQEEALRKAAEEKARQEELEAEEAAARQKEEEDRLEKLRLEEIARQEEERKAAEEAARIAELERQRLLEEQAAAAEAQRLQAEAEELQRQQEEALRKAAEEKARQEELEAELQRQKEVEEAARKEEEERLEKLRLEEIAKREEEERLEKERLEEIARREEEERLEKLRLEEIAKREEEERLEKERLEEIARREEEERLEKERLEEIAKREEEERLEKERLEEIARREEEERLEKQRLEEIAKQEEEERKAAEQKRLQEEEERLEKERLVEVARQEEEERKVAEQKRLQEEEEERVRLEKQKAEEEERIRKEEEERQRKEEEERLHQEELERKKVEEARLAAEAAAAEQAHQDEPSDPVEAPPAQVHEPESAQPAVEEPQPTEAPPASISEEHPADAPKEAVPAIAPPVNDQDDSEEEILVHAVPHPNAEN